MTGRPSDFTQEIADAICDGIALGRSLRSICREDEMPDQRAVFRWLHANEAFRQQYARAREMQADTLADETLDIADDATNDWMERQGQDGQSAYVLNGEHVQRSRLRIDQRKWMAGKLKPKVYGERVQVDANVRVKPAQEMSDDELAAIATGSSLIASTSAHDQGEPH
jgi:hypothetical protein